MKKTYLLLFLSILFLESCKKESDNSPVVYVDPSSIVFNAAMGEIVSFKIKANSPQGLSKMVVTYKESNTFTQTLVDSTLNGNENFSWTYEYQIPAKTEAYILDLGFTFTDNSGQQFSAARRINATVSNGLLTEFTSNIFYSKKSGQTDSYNLINRTSVYSTTAAASVRDLQNDGTYDSGDSLARAWVSPAGSKFVRFNSFDYDNATYSTVANTYEAGLKEDTIRNLQTGDIILTKVTRNTTHTYTAIKLTSIIDQSGASNDLYIFSIKK